MKTFNLTVIFVPADPQGDLIKRTYRVRASNLKAAEHSSTVFRVIPSGMDNVLDWKAVEVLHA